MPLYEFYNTETGDQWEDKMSYDDYKTFLSENPHINRVYSMNIIGGTGDRIKTDNGFKDVLSRVAEANPLSPLAAKHGSRDIKTTKTREAVDKFKKAALKNKG